jgi:hypothetical protein
MKDVARFISQFDNTDVTLHAHTALTFKIWPDQLEKTVFTIENKLSIGMKEKRRKYFKDNQIIYENAYKS